MTKQIYTGKGGQTWEWEETPEVLAAIKQLHKSSKIVESFNTKKNGTNKTK
tara:strand:- start:639 stop:791 length:153 start_codon:yes stop_codon:yes gene_type:complete